MHAADLFEKGMIANHVAKQIGVSREAVSTWKAIWEAHGRDGLKVQPLGARRRLSERDIEKLKLLISNPPPPEVSSDGHWTLKLIAEAIRRDFGIIYHHSHVTHLLKKSNITVKY